MRDGGVPEKRHARAYTDGGARSYMQQCGSVQQCMQRGKSERQAQSNHERKLAVGLFRHAQQCDRCTKQLQQEGFTLARNSASKKDYYTFVLS